MSPEEIRRDVRRKMDRYGVALSAVLGVGAEVSYTYTVGMQRLKPTRPELIVLGLPPDDGGELLHQLFERWRRGRATPQAGDVITGLDAADPDLPARLDRVRPAWVERYAGGVSIARNRPPRQVPVLQVVLADEHGRWPESPHAATVVRQQPLLGRADPWVAPLAHDGDALLDMADGDMTVAVPVALGSSGRAAVGGPDGERWELLSGRRLDGDHVEIRQVPWLARQVAYGDVVEAAPSDGRGGVPEGTPAACRVIDSGFCETLLYHMRARVRGRFHPSIRVGMALLAALSVDRGTRASATQTSVHVNTVDPGRVRTVLRPFERDGLLSASSGCHPDCSCAPSVPRRR